MFLPPPTEPRKILPNMTIYHLYPSDTFLEKDVFYKDKHDKVNKKLEKKRELAYLNCVMPTRQAEAFRKSKELFDFGLSDYVVDKDRVCLNFHNCYGKSEYGGRSLTNIVLWHKDTFVGDNPENARIIIGDEQTLVIAIRGMLKYLSDIPFMDIHVPDIVAYARSMGYGAVTFKGSNEWATPMWFVTRDVGLWNRIMTDFFKK